VTHYKGITSPPTNYSEWGQLVEKMANHLKNRYPGKKVMFEVWNEPNGGFWTPGPPGDETNSAIQQRTYFELYKQTADALHRVSPGDFQVGEPATLSLSADIHLNVLNNS
jgi:beta-xylosidase